MGREDEMRPVLTTCEYMPLDLTDPATAAPSAGNYNQCLSTALVVLSRSALTFICSAFYLYHSWLLVFNLLLVSV
ncbi:hypothetical protein RvY_15926-2 [Ramazzottius varieornatus]|uniref:Uncharacterized protein n=1 Tax=Ramazzottius varieornatus TaxID=947166 RepID=A0A1D1VWM9_RAMVA|nr:hypothetical protein RvY_15926-2 [Ramazzottius varieornatus]